MLSKLMEQMVGLYETIEKGTADVRPMLYESGPGLDCLASIELYANLL